MTTECSRTDDVYGLSSKMVLSLQTVQKRPDRFKYSTRRVKIYPFHLSGYHRYHIKIIYVIALVLVTLCNRSTDAACSFPTNFQGTWVTSNRGTWNVTSDEIQNFKVTVTIIGSELRDFECFDDSYNGYYIIKSKTIFHPFTTVSTYIYACLKLNQVSTEKYTFNLLSKLHGVTVGVSERVVLYSVNVTVTNMSAVCNDASTSADRDHVALRSGTESSGFITCPTNIQSTWSYEYTGKPCNSSASLDTCTDKTLFNYNETNCNPMFSSEQKLYCVYYGTSGSDTYLTLYNPESTITNPNTYLFSCMVYSISGSTVSMTINPEECLPSTLQSSSSITSSYGVIANFTDIAETLCNPITTDSTDVAQSSLDWLYALIAIGVIAIIIIIVIIICCIRKRRRKRRPQPDEEKQIKEDEEVEQEEEDKKDEDDTRSVDSGFIPDKIDKDEQEKVVRIEDPEKKEEEKLITDGKAEDDGVKDRPDTGINKSDSEGAGSDDPDEIERRIRMVGMKRPDHMYMPDGTLSKVLVTREMDEKTRQKKLKNKRKKIQKYSRGKSKKASHDKADGPTELEDEDEVKGHGGIKAEYMEQYHHKKMIEKKLDDEHYWSDEDDGKMDHLKLDDYDDEFEDSVPEETKNNVDDIVIIDVKDDSDDVSMADDNQMAQMKVHDKDREKDSGNDSPGALQTAPDVDNDAIINSDPDMNDVDDFEDDVFNEEYVRGSSRLPPGFIRDTEGKIIRLSDGQVISEEEMEKYFKRARIRRLFKVARLKRNKEGRPTGGFIQDDYGPEIETINLSNVGEDGLKRKLSRTSAGTHRISTADKHRRSLGKLEFQRTVAFNVNDDDLSDVSDIIKIDDDTDELKRKGRRDISTPNRDLLKKRLFKTKKRQRSKNGSHLIFVNGAEEKPRELNALVKVYGRNGMPIPPTDTKHPNPFSRTESGRGQMNPEQLQKFRQGLANDMKFLNKRGGPIRQAFMPTDEMTVENLSDEEHQQDECIRLGSEDEFVVVGGGRPPPFNQSQNEPFFKILRKPDQMQSLSSSTQSNAWCTKHDLRHSIPWSLRAENSNLGLSRANTGLQNNSLEHNQSPFDLPKSADHKRHIDDRRLKEILEELYKDKKYFDHMIDTTDDIDVNKVMDERDLAEHGRDRLLDKADQWEQKERDNPMPLPPWLVPSRMNTAFKIDSGRGSQVSNTSTATPAIFEQQRREDSIIEEQPNSPVREEESETPERINSAVRREEAQTPARMNSSVSREERHTPARMNSSVRRDEKQTAECVNSSDRREGKQINERINSSLRREERQTPVFLLDKDDDHDVSSYCSRPISGKSNIAKPNENKIILDETDFNNVQQDDEVSLPGQRAVTPHHHLTENTTQIDNAPDNTSQDTVIL